VTEYHFQYHGACDCGAVRLVYHCNAALDELQARACQCDYCRPAGLSYLSEPASRLQVLVRDMRYLYAQTFATATAEFMHCAVCNHAVYVRSEIEGNNYALVVAQTLAGWPLPIQVLPKDFGTESVADRLQRRRANWIGQLEETVDAG